MAWQRASSDGGPLEPHAWVTLHEPRPYAALDSRIAQALRERAEQDRLRARLATTQAEITRLTDRLAAQRASALRELAEGAVDLILAAVRLIGGGHGAPATSRAERRGERARLRGQLTAATRRRDTVREELERTSHVYRDLMSAVTEKAHRVIADKAEGWQQVREILHDDLPRAKSGFEQVERTRDRLREARLAAHRTGDALRPWNLRRDHVAGADAARAEARRLDDAVDALRRALTGLGPDAPELGAFPPLRIPPHGTPSQLRGGSEEALRVLAQVNRRLDGLGRLDAVATARIRSIAEAEDALVDLMRRPY